MSASRFKLRPYVVSDENAAIALWLRTWQATYSSIDFAARVEWWRQRWRNELVPTAKIVVAELDGNVAGFVTVDQATCYLDQLVAAPEAWGRGVADALIAEAKRLSPAGLDLHVNTDNLRAIRFYARHGFAITGDEANPISGRPVHRMRWHG